MEWRRITLKDEQYGIERLVKRLFALAFPAQACGFALLRPDVRFQRLQNSWLCRFTVFGQLLGVVHLTPRNHCVVTNVSCAKGRARDRSRYPISNSQRQSPCVEGLGSTLPSTTHYGARLGSVNANTSLFPAYPYRLRSHPNWRVTFRIERLAVSISESSNS